MSPQEGNLAEHYKKINVKQIEPLIPVLKQSFEQAENLDFIKFFFTPVRALAPTFKDVMGNDTFELPASVWPVIVQVWERNLFIGEVGLDLNDTNGVVALPLLQLEHNRYHQQHSSVEQGKARILLQYSVTRSTTTCTDNNHTQCFAFSITIRCKEVILPEANNTYPVWCKYVVRTDIARNSTTFDSPVMKPRSLPVDGNTTYFMEENEGKFELPFTARPINNTPFQDVILGSESRFDVPCTFSELTLVEQVTSMLLEVGCKVADGAKGQKDKACSLNKLQAVPGGLHNWVSDDFILELVKKKDELLKGGASTAAGKLSKIGTNFAGWLVGKSSSVRAAVAQQAEKKVAQWHAKTEVLTADDIMNNINEQNLRPELKMLAETVVHSLGHESNIADNDISVGYKVVKALRSSKLDPGLTNMLMGTAMLPLGSNNLLQQTKRLLSGIVPTVLAQMAPLRPPDRSGCWYWCLQCNSDWELSCCNNACGCCCCVQ